MPASKANGKTLWTKPYPDFPLSYHPPSGRLYKKIRGQRYYFGYADDWQAAIENRQDFSDRGADPKSLLDGALRRGNGEREAWIGPVGSPNSA